MYLNKVIVDNFRIFDGRYEFEFCNGFEHNLNIIFGSNSSGKSSLINAIHWCLFNSELFPNLSDPLYNYESVVDIGVEGISVSVECHFVDEENIIKIKRESVFFSTGENINIEDTYLDINIDDGSNISSADNYWLIKSFPRELFDFSVLSSRSFESFFEKNYMDNLKSMFYNYFKLDYIDSTIIHFEKFFRNLKKEDVSEFYREERYRYELDQLIMRKREVLDLIHALDDSILDNEHLLKQYKDELGSIAPDFKEMEIIKSKINSENKRMDKIWKKYHKFLFEIAIKALIVERFIKSNSSFHVDELENGSLENDKLMNTALYDAYRNTGRVFYELRRIDDIKKMRDDIRICEKRIMELSERLHRIRYSVENRSGDHGIEHISEKIIILESAQKDLSYRKTVLKNEKKYLEQNIKNLSRLLDNIERNRPLFDLHDSNLKLCSDAISLGNDLKNEVMKNELSNFNEIFNNIFIKNFKMSSKFIQVSIGDDFRVQLVNNHDKIVNPNDLQYTDKLMLVMAFLITIRECFEIDYPFILMDPFAYFDDENRNSVIKELLDSKSFNQIILILNESQYGDNVKIRLLKKIATEYELKNGATGFEVVKNGL